jgi:hypothetical protein
MTKILRARGKMLTDAHDYERIRSDTIGYNDYTRGGCYVVGPTCGRDAIKVTRGSYERT